GGAVKGERGNSREERTIARTGARKNRRPRAGGRGRATRADHKHGATSSSARRGTRTPRRTVERTRHGAARNRDARGAIAQGERGSRAAQAGRSREQRTIARTGARENSRPRAGGRCRATR